MSDGQGRSRPPSSSHHRQLAGRALAHLRNGYTYSGWVEVGSGIVTIDGTLNTDTGPSHRPMRIRRTAVRRTYPLRAVKRIDWVKAGE